MPDRPPLTEVAEQLAAQPPGRVVSGGVESPAQVTRLSVPAGVFTAPANGDFVYRENGEWVNKRIQAKDLPGDPLAWTRGDDVLLETFPRHIVAGTITVAAGMVFVVMARSPDPVTISRLRVCVRTAFTGLTDFRVGVWRSPDGITWTPAATSADVKASLAATGVKTLDLGSTVALNAGEIVGLGVAGAGQTAGALSGASLSIAALSSIEPVTNRQASGWAAGSALPVLGASAAGTNMPWLQALA